MLQKLGCLSPLMASSSLWMHQPRVIQLLAAATNTCFLGQLHSLEAGALQQVAHCLQLLPLGVANTCVFSCSVSYLSPLPWPHQLRLVQIPSPALASGHIVCAFSRVLALLSPLWAPALHNSVLSPAGLSPALDSTRIDCHVAGFWSCSHLWVHHLCVLQVLSPALDFGCIQCTYSPALTSGRTSSA